MALFARQPQPPELYGILDDGRDLYKQLNLPTSDYEYLGRYPLLHPPAGSSSSGVVGSNPTGEVSSYRSPASAAGHSHPYYSQSKRSPRMRPSQTFHEHEDSQPLQVSADPKGQSWFDPEAEVWKPKKSSTSNKRRKAPPARPAPHVPQQQAAPPVMYSYGSPAPPQGQPLTGIFIKEPAQQFERAKGPPRKSSQQPSLLPTNAYLAPIPTGYSTQTSRQPAGVLSPPSMATKLSINPPPNTGSWISAPPSSAGRRLVDDPSRRAIYLSSAPRWGRHGHVPYEDGSPIEPSGPRQILFVVNKDPDSGSELSPVLDKKSFVLNMPASSSKSGREHKLSDAPTPHRRNGAISPALTVTDLPIDSPLTGFLTSEGEQPFAQTIASARRPATKTLDQRSSLLPTNARNLPVPSSYPIQTPSSPSTVTNLSIKPPPSIESGWTPRWSRAETATSALNSEFGTSTSTSFSNFRSSAAFSSWSYYSHSAPRFSALDPVTSEDDYPIEPPTSVPRQNLSITNEDRPSLRARYDSDSGASALSLEVEPTPGERVCPLPLTLEELFEGGMHTYRVTTLLLSGEPKVENIYINIEPGSEAGTRIISHNSGDELAPGVFQTMVFVVEQIHHERFTRRKGGELMYNQNINLVDAVKDNGKREARKVVGLDGKVIEFYPPKGVINHGQETLIKGEGMYTTSNNKVVGRGDLAIRWNITCLDRVIPDQIKGLRGIPER